EGRGEPARAGDRLRGGRPARRRGGRDDRRRLRRERRPGVRGAAAGRRRLGPVAGREGARPCRGGSRPRGAPGAGPVRPERRPARSGGSARAGPGGGDPERRLPARRAAAPAARGLVGAATRRWAAPGPDRGQRYRGARGRRWRSGRLAGGRGHHHRTDGWRGRAYLRGGGRGAVARARRRAGRRGGRSRRGDPGTNPAPGTAADRRRELRPPGHRDATGWTVSARERHIAEVAATLRGRLVERRRAEAAAGRRHTGDLEGSVRELVDEEAAILPAADRAEIAARVVRDSVGLGPLEILLADPLVEEVMVNGPDRVFVERAGRIEPPPIAFADEEELRDAIERILAPLGRRVDELSPMVDARL